MLRPNEVFNFTRFARAMYNSTIPAIGFQQSTFFQHEAFYEFALAL